MTTPEPGLFYEFGEYRLDARRRVLSRADGTSVPLKSKVFETLLYLVEHNGELLDKDALMQAVWPKLVVEESNLNKNISVLRQVLGETPDEHRFIVTEPGRGYRFVAEVRRVVAEPPAAGTGSRASKTDSAEPALRSQSQLSGSADGDVRARERSWPAPLAWRFRRAGRARDRDGLLGSSAGTPTGRAPARGHHPANGRSMVDRHFARRPRSGLRSAGRRPVGPLAQAAECRPASTHPRHGRRVVSVLVPGWTLHRIFRRWLSAASRDRRRRRGTACRGHVGLGRDVESRRHLAVCSEPDERDRQPRPVRCNADAGHAGRTAAAAGSFIAGVPSGRAAFLVLRAGHTRRSRHLLGRARQPHGTTTALCRREGCLRVVWLFAVRSRFNALCTALQCLSVGAERGSVRSGGIRHGGCGHQLDRALRVRCRPDRLPPRRWPGEPARLVRSQREPLANDRRAPAPGGLEPVDLAGSATRGHVPCGRREHRHMGARHGPRRAEPFHVRCRLRQYADLVAGRR